MKTEKFETVIDGTKYTFRIWGSCKMWSANAYTDSKFNNAVAIADSDSGSDDVILKLVKLLERTSK